jgi:hypothetical protein
VNGQFLADERVYLRAKGGGLVGCAATDAKSRGTMVYTRNTPTLSDDVEIDYIAESRGTAGQIVSSVRGVNGGQGIANREVPWRRGDPQTVRGWAVPRRRLRHGRTVDHAACGLASRSDTA